MPTLKHAGLILSIATNLTSERQAPWCWDTWEALTGVPHNWLEDNGPTPDGLRDEDMKAIRAFVREFVELNPKRQHMFLSETSEDNFSSGRRSFLPWFNRRWGHWNLNSRIEKAMQEAGYHPIDAMAVGGNYVVS